MERWAGLFVVGCLAALPLPALLGLGSPNYSLAALLIAVLAWAAMLAQKREDRRFFGGLFCFGLALRLWTLIVIQTWAVSSGGPYLGPDATAYLERSLTLAREDIQAWPALSRQFQGYDSAHYLLFAAQIRFLGADLFGLQLFNAAATALVGPFVFALARMCGTRWAPPLAVVAAVYPSIIALSVNDLLKDPVLIAGTMAGVWAVASALWARAGSGQWLCALVGGLLLGGVRASRGYVVAFVEAGFLGALAVQWVMCPAPPVRPRQWVALGLAILIAEGLPASLGWPLSPTYIRTQVRHSLASPGMHVYASGLLDRGTSSGGSVLQPPSVASGETRGTVDRGTSSGGSVLQPPSVASGETRGTEPAPLRSGEGSAPTATSVHDYRQRWGRITVHAANTVRRLFGPFPWVAPPRWNAETILRGDYLLFPGMFVWYAVLPVSAVGAGRMGWLALRCRAVPPVVLVSSFFVTCLGTMYLTLNLSYRQREFMFPFLLLTAAAAVDGLGGKAFWRRAYLGYWAMLLLLATVHLTLRATLS